MNRVPLARLSSLRACQRIGMPHPQRPALGVVAARNERRPGPMPAWIRREAARLRALWLDDLAMAAAEGLPVRR